ncbi:uncharacterized protein C14orf132 homolog [Ambystoma mexicanum]|uniref:uncharacterized protein C14orf132 homolog n=1 Tax=Ambystoma mexicanum TaxID=8296 RepID=UPI0037E72467
MDLSFMGDQSVLLRKIALSSWTGAYWNPFLPVAEKFPAMSGIFMDAPYHDNISLHSSISTLSTSGAHGPEDEDKKSLSCEAIWLWIAIIATVGNIVVVGIVCVCTF